MAQCLIHEEATTLTDALTEVKCIRGEKQLHPYMTKYIRLNYLMPKLMTSAQNKKKQNILSKTRQDDSCKHEGSRLFV